MNKRCRLAKIRRIQKENSPRVLDLFAGCGGFSLGFSAAGFEIVGAIELDPLAALSHALNFCKGATPRRLQAHAKSRDITRVEPEDFVRELGPVRVTDVVDVIIGGPLF
jgi:DNA (cytosine-5)-methyltransferase 1